MTPALSLILCSRNDRYQGNSRWRLETTLNYTAEQVRRLGRERDVEILVADWGSDVPLGEVVRLTPAAAGLVSFLAIPPARARALQGDSAFPEVLALNAAARRSEGAYIGRIDQDTLVGARFFEWFFRALDGRAPLEAPLDRALLYANRRDVPYWFAVRCPPMPQVERFVERFDRRLPVPRWKGPFWAYFVGVWLAHRDRWHECRGYDERLLHYNWMEVEMIGRLARSYPVIDLGALVDYSFYHLEHVNPRRYRRGHDKQNAPIDWRTPPAERCPNPADWGLAAESLARTQVAAATAAPDTGAGSWRDRSTFVALVARVRLSLALDRLHRRLVFFPRRWLLNWVGRAKKIRLALRGQPLGRWPGLVLELKRRGRAQGQ